MKRKLIIAGVVLLLMMGGVPARAEGLSMNMMLEIYAVMRTAEERKTIESRLTTIEDGLGWANVELRHRNTSSLYCPPDKIALTGTQLIDILRRAVKDDPQIGKYPVGLALLRSLEQIFPCKD